MDKCLCLSNLFKEFMIVLIFRVQLQLISTPFLLNNLYNSCCGGECFFVRFRNIFLMSVFTFLLYILFNQMFLFHCFLLLVVFIFAWYLSLCLYFSKASWYSITDSLNISSDEVNDESLDPTEIESCWIIDNGWLD